MVKMCTASRLERQICHSVHISRAYTPPPQKKTKGLVHSETKQKRGQSQTKQGYLSTSAQGPTKVGPIQKWAQVEFLQLFFLSPQYSFAFV